MITDTSILVEACPGDAKCRPIERSVLVCRAKRKCSLNRSPKCRTCNKVYIRGTGRRLGDRFREHLRSARQTNTDLSIGRHFASPGHASTDMLVSVINSGFRATQNRRLFEAKMIFNHKTLHPGGLNTDFAFLETPKIC